MEENLMQRKRKYLLMPKKELAERCLLIEEEIERLNNIINKFDNFITEVDSHINLGDESEEFILVRDKWLELQELKGSDK